MNDPLKIFLIDDDMEDVFLIKRAFEKTDHNIIFKHLGDGYKFLNDVINGGYQKVDTNSSVFLLDINMPEVSGFDILRTMHKTSHTKYFKFLMLSTSESEADKSLALKLGAEQFFSKPSRFDDLKILASEIIKQYGR